MNAAIICVGTELLLGDVLNTNAKYISKRLAEQGINVYSHLVVGDNRERLSKCLTQVLPGNEIVILTGGLGPTADDITKEVVAETLNLPLEPHKKSLEQIEDYFLRTGKQMGESNKKQALTVKGATVLPNNNGTAPGYIIESGNNKVILLPGPPKELVPMFEESVSPYIAKLCEETIYSKNIRIFGIGESMVAEQCGDLLELENPTVATYADTGETYIRITAKAKNKAEADALINPIADKINDHFGTHIYGINVNSLEQRVVELLTEQGKKVATAESCTAGMLSGRITEIAGASAVFEMGITAYANYVKEQALGVDRNDIANYGAVSKEVAAQMARGVRKLCNADLGVGITGVAGPGASEGKPAGLVYIAIADKTRVFVRKIMCRGTDRQTTRIIASSTALDMIRRYLIKADDLFAFGSMADEPIKLLEGYTLINSEPIKINESGFNTLEPNLNEKMLNGFEMFKHLTLSENGADGGVAGKLNTDKESAAFAFDDDKVFEDKEKNVPGMLGSGEQTKLFYGEEVFKNNRAKRPKGKIFKNFKNGFINLFPSKKNKAGENVRKIAFWLFLILLIVSAVKVVSYFTDSFNRSKKAEEAANSWYAATASNKEKTNEDGTLISFDELKEKNSDIKGWLKINNCKINYPVYQTDDNDFYLNHDMDKKSSKYGALFIDKDSQIGREKNGRNTVIYGHSMRDGAMFGELKKFLDISFYSKNKIIDFTSLYSANKYKVFAVFVTNTLPEHNSGEVFDYSKSSFISENDFNAWINSIQQKSIITTNIDVNFDDEILTLSTCAYDFEGARLVVMARKIRNDSEDAESKVEASLNKSPVYPEIWYTKKGIKKPEVTTSSANSSTASEMSNAASSSTVSGNVLDTPTTENGEVLSSNTSVAADSSTVGTSSASSGTVTSGNASVGGSSSASFTDLQSSSEVSSVVSEFINSSSDYELPIR